MVPSVIIGLVFVEGDFFFLVCFDLNQSWRWLGIPYFDTHDSFVGRPHKNSMYIASKQAKNLAYPSIPK